MSRFHTSITKRGIFWTADIDARFGENVRTMMEAVAAEAQADVRGQMQAGEGTRAPLKNVGEYTRVSQAIVGRVASLAGKPWYYNTVVSPSREGLGATEAIGLYAAAASIEEAKHPIRTTAGRVRRAKAVTQAQLLNGISQ